MSNMLSGERRGGITVIGKIAVPKPINLPSQRSENHGLDSLDPSVEIVPKSTLSWGSRSSSSTSNVWGSSTQSPRTDGGNCSLSHVSGRPSSGGSGTRPSTAGSDRAHEPTHGMQGRAHNRGKGGFNSQEERWRKIFPVADSPNVVSASRSETNSNLHVHDCHTSVEASEQSGSYPQVRDEGESAPPVFDRSDYRAQRPKMKELAKQRAKQRMEGEEERIKKQKAKAEAKLEELNRLITLAVEGSTQKSENAASIVTVSIGGVVDGISSSCESSLPVNSNPVAVSSIHQRKKNNRSGKNKHKVAWGAAGTAEKMNCSSMDRTEFAEVGGSCDAALVAVIDRKMKELAENLIHAVEGISARVSQLESRTRRFENSIDELKDSVEINYGRNDGKLRELEITLREVQGGIQDLRDKQEIPEAKLQLSKLQLSSYDQQSKNQNSSVQSNSAQGELSSVPQQIHQPLKVPVAPPQQLPALPIDVLPSFPHWYTSPISSTPAAQLPTQLLQNQIPSIPRADSYHPPPPVLTLESSHQQSQQPPQSASQLPPVSQLSQLPQLHPPPSSVTPYAHHPSSDHPKEIPYMPSQTHPPITHKLSHAADGAPPTQQFYLGSTQQMHDQASSNPYSEFPSSHSQSPGISNFYDLHSYSGSPSRYSSSTMKPSQLSPSPLVPGGGHLWLPTAQTLPHAIPMASNVDGGSGSSGTGNCIAINGAVENVVAMGFRRDLVRATVRKLTENGQSVDLNMVLDKLMDNGEVEPQIGKFGK